MTMVIFNVVDIRKFYYCVLTFRKGEVVKCGETGLKAKWMDFRFPLLTMLVRHSSYAPGVNYWNTVFIEQIWRDNQRIKKLFKKIWHHLKNLSLCSLNKKPVRQHFYHFHYYLSLIRSVWYGNLLYYLPLLLSS